MTDAAGTSPSRRRWLLVALTVSIAFNLFFVGVLAGSISATRPRPGQPDRFERITQRMRLGPAQRAAFHRFQVALRQHGGAMHRANTVVWDKLADPKTDQNQIPTLLATTVQNRTAFQQDVVDALQKFLASLTPLQRANFIAEARAEPHPHGPLVRLRQLLH